MNILFEIVGTNAKSPSPPQASLSSPVTENSTLFNQPLHEEKDIVRISTPLTIHQLQITNSGIQNTAQIGSSEDSKGLREQGRALFTKLFGNKKKKPPSVSTNDVPNSRSDHIQTSPPTSTSTLQKSKIESSLDSKAELAEHATKSVSQQHTFQVPYQKVRQVFDKIILGSKKSPGLYRCVNAEISKFFQTVNQNENASEVLLTNLANLFKYKGNCGMTVDEEQKQNFVRYLDVLRSKRANAFDDMRLELYQITKHYQGLGFDTSTTSMPSMPILSEETNTKDETPFGVSKAGKEIYDPPRIPSPNFRRKISVAKPKLKGNDILIFLISVFNKNYFP